MRYSTVILAVAGILLWMPQSAAGQLYLLRDFNSLNFEAGVWLSSNPDPAGCISYTATRNNAMFEVDSPGVGVEKFQTSENSQVIICNEAAHLPRQSQLLDERAARVLPGYLVIKYRAINFGANNWQQNFTMNAFIVKYSALQANSLFRLLPRESEEFYSFRAQTGGRVLVSDRTAHLDNIIDRVPLDIDANERQRVEPIEREVDAFDALLEFLENQAGNPPGFPLPPGAIPPELNPPGDIVPPGPNPPKFMPAPSPTPQEIMATPVPVPSPIYGF